MLDLKLLQKHPEVVAKALADRHSNISVDDFLAMDERRRAVLTEVETLKSKRNADSAEVARKKRAGEDASELLADLGKLSDRIKELDAEASEIKDKVYQWMLRVPNIPTPPCRSASTKTTIRNCTAGARPASSPSRPSSTLKWARPAAASTLNAAPSSPVRASACRTACSPEWNAPS